MREREWWRQGRSGGNKCDMAAVKATGRGSSTIMLVTKTAVVVVIALLAGASAPVAAQEEESGEEGALANSHEVEGPVALGSRATVSLRAI